MAALPDLSRLAPLIVTLAGLLAGCTTVVDKHSGTKYRVHYKDTNKDGHVDTAYFTPGGIDGDFVVRDADFDGRYESAIVLGYGILYKTVDYPVYLDEAKTKLNKGCLTP